jgi:hypothetical protein
MKKEHVLPIPVIYPHSLNVANKCALLIANKALGLISNIEINKKLGPHTTNYCICYFNRTLFYYFNSKSSAPSIDSKEVSTEVDPFNKSLVFAPFDSTLESAHSVCITPKYRHK